MHSETHSTKGMRTLLALAEFDLLVKNDALKLNLKLTPTKAYMKYHDRLIVRHNIPSFPEKTKKHIKNLFSNTRKTGEKHKYKFLNLYHNLVYNFAAMRMQRASIVGNDNLKRENIGPESEIQQPIGTPGPQSIPSKYF